MLFLYIRTPEPFHKAALQLIARTTPRSADMDKIFSFTVNISPMIRYEDDPLSIPLVDGQTWQHGRYRIQALESYDITSRVVRKKRYHDDMADLCPWDFGVAWGQMAEPKNYEQFRFWQSERFLYCQYKSKSWPPVSQRELSHTIANIHLVPATKEILARLAAVQEGEKIRLIGVLIAAVRDDGMAVRSSTTRDDTGAGACEIMWVDEVSLVEFVEL